MWLSPHFCLEAAIITANFKIFKLRKTKTTITNTVSYSTASKKSPKVRDVSITWYFLNNFWTCYFLASLRRHVYTHTHPNICSSSAISWRCSIIQHIPHKKASSKPSTRGSPLNCQWNLYSSGSPRWQLAPKTATGYVSKFTQASSNYQNITEQPQWRVKQTDSKLHHVL